MWCSHRFVEYLGELENPYYPTDPRYIEQEANIALYKAAKARDKEICEEFDRKVEEINRRERRRGPEWTWEY